MTHKLAPTNVRDRGGYVVRKPRASDAVGGSLRNVYQADPLLPGEWMTLLRRIDACAH